MNKFYTNERNVQIVIALLKANNIKRIIVSPGATNITFVGSIQNDPFFSIYSCVDERSAAYMACGMAAETGEPVVINCTGATSSRNWMPGLTEAYYRKLPILAISSSQESYKIGQLVAQVTDRSTPPVDTVVRSLEIGLVDKPADEQDAIIKANTAISLLTRNGGGPVHINLITGYSRDYSVQEIPDVRCIKRLTIHDELLELPKGRIAIGIGNHIKLTKEETSAIDTFCEQNNAVVFCDHTSGYYGRFKVNMALSIIQKHAHTDIHKMELLIHFGEVSGDYYNLYILKPNHVWRISNDGEMRDLYHKLDAVFDMDIMDFFKHYSKASNGSDISYYKLCRQEYETLVEKLPELPFSNLWVAQHTAPLLPSNSILHLGILNSLRSWNFFQVPNAVVGFSNTGGFGIDGVISTAVGASICSPDKIVFCVIGDLAFFYDMNVIGNRHVGNNIRILLINNGRGQEFRNYTHDGNLFGSDADKYIAAAGHNGNMSNSLVKGIAESLGYSYLSANGKEDFLSNVKEFTNPVIGDKPMLFEVFTDTTEESEALEQITSYCIDKKQKVKEDAKAAIKNLVGEKIIATIKKVVK